MQITITKAGCFLVNKEVKQCPFTQGDNVYYCGDWCAHFTIIKGKEDIMIALCHQKTWTCRSSNFNDERELK